ncbi:hypothetical protein GGH94_001444 [Coemansia aciculifera]|uniref:Prokaryotic-type class I peptide chain release factors domain-containing protein n=1 Tax=Coemansia aciculifera TaxID=417176 RepID=A0A9W8IKP7_9FUNG|nr:hypothetical protein GGH94_001444 [Coemansia aciculifera]
MHKLVLTKVQELSDLIDLAVEQDDAELKQYLIGGDIEEVCALARELYLSRLLRSSENADAAITITAGAGGVDSCDWTQMLATMYRQCGRSQIQNRATCLDLLRARLHKRDHDRQQQQKATERGQLPANAWGSQVRSYVLQPRQLVKDSRSGHSSTQASSVLGGDIDEFLMSHLEFAEKNKL